MTCIVSATQNILCKIGTYMSAFCTFLWIASEMPAFSLQVIPNTKMELDEWEHVTCLKNVSLAYEGTRSGLKGYIAVGTNYNYGEDITSRGRVRTS